MNRKFAISFLWCRKVLKAFYLVLKIQSGIGDVPTAHTLGKPFSGVRQYTYQRSSRYILIPQFDPL